MATSNVVVLTSKSQTIAESFIIPRTLIKVVGRFLDAHNTWDTPAEIILVHRNGTVLRHRFSNLASLEGFTMGFVVGDWLYEHQIPRPSLVSSDWTKDQ